MKSFVKGYPDIIGYVDEEIASADGYGPEQRAHPRRSPRASVVRRSPSRRSPRRSKRRGSNDF